MSPQSRIFRYARFDLPALLTHAASIRKTLCTCDASQEPMSGCHNWAIILSFDDNNGDWIFRSPRSDFGFCDRTRQKMIESEVASNHAARLIGIPVVEVISYSGTSSNDIGVPFILETKAPGYPIDSKFTWNPYPTGSKLPRCPLPPFPRAAKEKIMIQLGMITSKSIQRKWHMIGSLYQTNGEFHVGEALSRSLTWSSRDTFDDIARGPFKDTNKYYKSLLSAFIRHIEMLPLDQHVFLAPVPKRQDFSDNDSYQSAVRMWNDFVTVGSKIDSRRNRLDYIAMAHLLRDIIPLISAQDQSFYLKHPDYSTSNIFINDHFEITCIIDWASTTTVPLSMLLLNPSFPHPRDDEDPALSKIFKDTVISQSPQFEEVLHPGSWELAQKCKLFERLVDFDSLQDYSEFLKLYTSVFSGTNEVNMRKRFNAVREDISFIERIGAQLRRDPDDSEIRSQENDYFRRQPEAESLARRLTEAWSNPYFVADSSLWKQFI